MVDRVLRGAEVVLTMDDERSRLTGVDVHIAGGVIAAIGPDLQVAGAESVNVAGCVLTPGLVNTHHHLYQTLTRAVPGGRMPCCLAGCRRSIQFGRGLVPKRCLFRPKSGWWSWHFRAAR